MQVVVNSLLTAYELSQGKESARKSKHERQKPKILLLHGWGDSAKGWQHVVHELANDFQVCVPDLPGFGASQAPPKPWGLTDYAEFITAFLKKTRFTPDIIIGHSNGGAIAIRGLAHGVLSADKLVLLSSAGIRSEYKGRKKLLRVITKAGKVLTYPLPRAVRHRLRRQVYTTVGSDMLVAEHLQETFKKVVTDDVQADAAVLHIPTLLVYGEADQHTPVQYGRVLHNLIAGSTLEVIGEAGHFAHLDKPAQTLTIIRKFLGVSGESR